MCPLAAVACVGGGGGGEPSTSIRYCACIRMIKVYSACLPPGLIYKMHFSCNFFENIPVNLLHIKIRSSSDVGADAQFGTP